MERAARGDGAFVLWPEVTNFQASNLPSLLGVYVVLLFLCCLGHTTPLILKEFKGLAAAESLQRAYFSFDHFPWCREACLMLLATPAPDTMLALLEHTSSHGQRQPHYWEHGRDAFKKDASSCGFHNCGDLLVTKYLSLSKQQDPELESVGPYSVSGKLMEHVLLKANSSYLKGKEVIRSRAWPTRRWWNYCLSGWGVFGGFNVPWL